MDAITVTNKALLLEQLAQPIHLPSQGFTQESQGDVFNQNPFHWKAGRFDKGGATCQSAKSNIHFTVLPMDSCFHPSCDQVCLRTMLLITAKAVFLRTKQNNNSNC